MNVNARDCDLPVRLIFVVGMPSGGTSCTAGILAKNGFYTGKVNRAYESSVAGSLSEGVWARPTRTLPAKMHSAALVFLAFKKEALDAGYDKAVLKHPGGPIWTPELFEDNSLGIKVEPLLVYRDPKECALSIIDRFNGKENALLVAERGQDEIKRLHEVKGWPMWTFSKQANVKELEDLLGVKLPTPHFDADRPVN